MGRTQSVDRRMCHGHFHIGLIELRVRGSKDFSLDPHAGGSASFFSRVRAIRFYFREIDSDDNIDRKTADLPPFFPPVSACPRLLEPN